MDEKTSRMSSLERLFSDHRFHLAVVTLLSGLFLFFNLSDGGLSGYDDAFYAHQGQEMLSTGDWWTLRFNGELNFEKPPMFIWMEAASIKFWGMSDFAAKFPAALCGLLTIITVFFLGKKLSRNFWLPVCAAWVMMLTQYFLKYSMHSMTDVPYTLFFTLAILAYAIGLERPGFLVWCGVAIGCATLTRSVLGLIPAAIVVSHVALTHRLRLFKSAHFVAGMALALLLPGIWYASQFQLHGDSIFAGHFYQVSVKVSSAERFDIPRFLWGLTMYPWSLLTLYWPWLPFMLVGLWGQTRSAVRDRESSAVLLATWVLLVIGPLSLAEAKVLRYIMPVFPAFALLSAIPISGWLVRVGQPRYVRAGYLGLCAVVFGIVVFTVPFPRAEEMSQIGSAVHAETTSSERVVLYTYGEPRHDTRNQFLWYSGRYCDWLLDPAELVRLLDREESRVFVVDRPSYDLFVIPSGAEIENLRDTGNWVSFRKL